MHSERDINTLHGLHRQSRNVLDKSLYGQILSDAVGVLGYRGVGRIGTSLLTGASIPSFRAIRCRFLQMRNYIMLLAPLVNGREKQRPSCNLEDFQQMVMMSDSLDQIGLTGVSCIAALEQPITAEGILDCLKSTGAQIHNGCVDCIFQSITPQQMTCMVNCMAETQTEGCDACQQELMVTALGNCLPRGIAGLVMGQLGGQGNGTDVSSILSGLGGSMNGGPHRGPNGALRCTLGEMAKIMPHGKRNIDNFVSCVGNLTSPTESWTPCFPSTEEVYYNSVCIGCVTNVFSQLQTACSDVCTDGLTLDTCKNCLRHTASMGMGLCTGVAEAPVQAACNALDANIFSANEGPAALLNCKNGNGPMQACIENSDIAQISSPCRQCVMAAPTWSSLEPQPCNCTMMIPQAPVHGEKGNNNPHMVCDEGCNNARPPVDQVSVDACFDPNGLRRPGDVGFAFGINDTVALLMPACSPDDMLSLSDASTDVTSCLNTTDPHSCVSTVTPANATCTQCVAVSMQTECQDTECWDQELSTSVGSCMYSGFPIQALADLGNPITTTAAPKSASVPSTPFTIIMSSILIIYHIF